MFSDSFTASRTFRHRAVAGDRPCGYRAGQGAFVMPGAYRHRTCDADLA
ncbi:hypothetical protein ACFXPT_38550 [Streptomyces goshikiensis]